MANQPENTYNRNEASLLLAKSAGDQNLTGYYYKKLFALVENKELNLIKKGRYWYFPIDEISRLAELEAQNAKNRAKALSTTDDIRHKDDVHLNRIVSIIEAHRNANVPNTYTIQIIKEILTQIEDTE